MRIGIPLSKNAYTPEAYAYENYLSNLGWSVQLDHQLDPNNDINLMFMGLDPFWKKNTGKSLIVHEYQSLSIPPYSNLKDYYKQIVNRKPTARIFLNHIVYSSFSFKDEIPYIFRDMGVDEIFFQKPSENPKYDVVYCGSIKNRSGLLDCLIKIAELGFKIIVVGEADDDIKEHFSKFKNLVFYGRASRAEIADIYKNCKYGLNYTPDIFPFNVQTSTKTLEYLASGLTVISNKYEWSLNLSKDYNLIWIDDLLNNDFSNSNYSFDISKFKDLYSWNCVLKSSNFETFLLDLL